MNSFYFRMLCGSGENKKMSVQDTIEDLTEICMNLRHNIKSLDQKEKENIVLKHIKEFADTDIRICDFQKGLEWCNVSEELSVVKHLAGKITILDFFTYCCINCMHILPDLDALEKKYSIEDGLAVIGVHSAKFANERNSEKILSAVQRYNIGHPVVNDSQLSMWRDIGISCWPSLVILGPKSQPLFVLVGEGHRELLFLYVRVALDYFNSLNQISNHSLPLNSVQHLLPASRGNLLFPGKIHAFKSENGEKLIVSDTGNNRILIMNGTGKVEIVIGGCAPGFEDGNFEKARFNAPQGICALENWIFVADNENHAVRKIDLVAKTVTTVAGNGTQGHDYSGGKLGRDQVLSSPWDVAIYQHKQSESGVPVLLIAIAGTHQIWALFLQDTIWWKKKNYKAGTCAAIVGSGREENRNNSYPHAANLAQPSGLAVSQELGAVFFADSESSAIRRVHLEDGKVSAVCGADKNPSNLHCFGDIDGKQYSAKLQHPLGVAWDSSRKLVYIADTYNHKIKKVDPEGNCSTLFGAGKPSFDHKFNEPSGLALNNAETILYIADTNNHCIKSIDIETGKIDTLTIVLPEEKYEADRKFEFETTVGRNAGQLTISFKLIFESNLKLNTEAPQRWSLKVPPTWSETTNLTGSLETPIHVQYSPGEEDEKIHIFLNIVACKTTECIPMKILTVFNVHRDKNNSPNNLDRKIHEILYLK
ncbi:NHL repeat-containing protein 2 [Leptopilina heterotoma]|uniref:NHL repeat-containing protein 2 n=1 Tax=Leptopilina heterotoma TaxID=63436 RepID=UPI001CA9B491|nr:NHL repeat-containing protein 2 [Leptopilina heterotoma]